MSTEQIIPTKKRILQAATEIALKKGTSNFTLEAVAHKAGLSKGGLLYHFPTKDDLITGLVESCMEEFESQMNKYYCKEPDIPGSSIRAYVRATFLEQQQMQEISAALLTAVTENPALLKPMQKQYESLQNILENDEIDAVIANVIRFAADGLWFAELFNIAVPNQQMKDQILEVLLKLSDKNGADAITKIVKAKKESGVDGML